MVLDSKLRGYDLVNLKVSDVAYGSSVPSRATVLQQKTGSPVQFGITKGTREAVAALIKLGNWHSKDSCFGLEASLYSTHSMRRTTLPSLNRLKSRVIRAATAVLCRADVNDQALAAIERSAIAARVQLRST
jgi:hypothetical protein